MSRLKKCFGLVAVLGALMSVSLMAPATSQASAYGCAGGNPWYGPSYYCVLLAGSGTYVQYVRGDFRGSGWACNYSVTAEFFDTSWRWYSTRVSPTRWGCATGGGETIGVYGYVRSGFMCSTLRYGDPWGNRRSMSVCHRVA